MKDRSSFDTNPNLSAGRSSIL